jgi:hypothetical protein
LWCDVPVVACGWLQRLCVARLKRSLSVSLDGHDQIVSYLLDGDMLSLTPRLQPGEMMGSKAGTTARQGSWAVIHCG